ncbi:MAG TPA: DUF5324 family protein [Actinomycetes bacterium]|nr:DUF5324 family protein [Actinomycetes bacterium]
MSRTLTLRKSKSRPVAVATKDWAAPKVETARDWAAPKVESGVDKVKTDVLPVVAGAVTAALAASEPVRTEAASRGSAALAALKGEVEAPKPKKHRLRKLFLLATVLGAAYAGWKAWASQQQSDDPVSPWTSDSGTTSMSTVSPVRPATDDPGGAGPDEALADAVDEATAVEDGSPAATEPVIEPVTPGNAKKVSDAASKGATKKS